jgi:cytochrome c553
MKKYLWMTMIAVALVMMGCSDQSKEDVKKAAQSVGQDATKAAETTQQKASDAMESAKKQASEAMESAKAKSAEMEKAAKAKAAEAAAAVEKKAAEVKEKLKAETADTPKEAGEEETMKAAPAAKPAAETVAPSKNGATLYAKCAGCHGADGQTKALGKSPAIAGQDAAQLKTFLEEYKAGTRNAYGMGGVMAGQMKGLSEKDIAVLADYISKL